jgi:hypothetical protein
MAVNDNRFDPLDMEVLAAQYDFATATINDDKTLRAVFEWAAKQGPDLPDAAFIAKLKGSDWYKSNGKSWKKAWAAERAGDTTWTDETLPNERDRIMERAGTLGVRIDENEATKLAKLSLYSSGNQWSDNALDSRLVRDTAADQNLKSFDTGTSFNMITEGLKRISEANGLSYSNAWYKRMATRILDPKDMWDRDKVYGLITDDAGTKFPALKDQIGKYETPDGETGYSTVRDAANDYIGTLSQMWDIQAKDIKLDDPVLKQALNYGDLKNPSTMPKWMMEKVARADDRWLVSSQGQQHWGNIADNLARQFGVDA